MIIINYILITMIYGFIMVGILDAIKPLKKHLKAILAQKRTRDGDISQQRRALCWTNAPLTSPTKA